MPNVYLTYHTTLDLVKSVEEKTVQTIGKFWLLSFFGLSGIRLFGAVDSHVYLATFLVGILHALVVDVGGNIEHI